MTRNPRANTEEESGYISYITLRSIYEELTILYPKESRPNAWTILQQAFIVAMSYKQDENGEGNDG